MNRWQTDYWVSVFPALRKMHTQDMMTQRPANASEFTKPPETKRLHVKSRSGNISEGCAVAIPEKLVLELLLAMRFVMGGLLGYRARFVVISNPKLTMMITERFSTCAGCASSITEKRMVRS